MVSSSKGTVDQLAQRYIDVCAENEGLRAALVEATKPLDVIEQAVLEYGPACTFGLFSGGHDSVTSTHIAAQHPSFRGVLHVNTGIGIEETREYVRQICRDQDWPLIEEHAPEGVVRTKLPHERHARWTDPAWPHVSATQG